MLLRELGFAFVLLLAIFSYLFFRKKKADVALSNRWLFVLGALFLGLVIDCLDKYYIKQDFVLSRLQDYFYITAICFFLYLPVLLLPQRFRKYPLAVYTFALFCFLAYGVYGNFKEYYEITSRPKCVPEAFANMSREAPPSEMERVFKIQRPRGCKR